MSSAAAWCPGDYGGKSEAPMYFVRKVRLPGHELVPPLTAALKGNNYLCTERLQIAVKLFRHPRGKMNVFDVCTFYLFLEIAATGIKAQSEIAKT